MRGFIALLLMVAPVCQAQATDDDVRSVAAMVGRARVLLVFAPSLQDPRLSQQRAEMARFAIGAAQRDLSFVQVDQTHVLGAKDPPEQLRAQFQVPAGAYRTLLIGKDGKVALSEPGPLTADRIAQTIDAMPSRQEEVRRAREGHPVPPQL